MLAEIIWDKGMLAVVMAMAVPIIWIIANAWYKVERARSADNLKRKMVERGMSADEIERVINAGPAEPVEE